MGGAGGGNQLYSCETTLSFDAAPNYKYMFGPLRHPLLHLRNITVIHLKYNTVIKQSKGLKCDLKPEHKKTHKQIIPTTHIDSHWPSETDSHHRADKEGSKTINRNWVNNYARRLPQNIHVAFCSE